MSTAETTSLLLEIGCEEIPARFLKGAESGLVEQLRQRLFDKLLLVVPGGGPIFGSAAVPLSPVHTFSTPRRLIVYMPVVLPSQFRIKHIRPGPAVKVGVGPNGQYTRAAKSFAAKNNAKVSDLKRVTNAKGEYLVLEIEEPGRSALEVLHEVLPVVLDSLSFPKNMYWTAKAGPLFVRPIRWILALLGEGKDAEVVPFEFAGVKSGDFTFGHRLKGSAPIHVTGFDDYMKKQREHMVEPDPKVRRERTQQGIKVLLEGENAKTVADDWLEDWVVNSTEWPVPLMGSFDPRYLALPREVLVTVMRDHQKYFAVEDKAGNLKPHFITVLNVPGDPKGLIRQGHERVLAARFADAEFFWNVDRKITLAERLPMLERVTYQAKLGTYAVKVGRMRTLGEKICAELEKSGQMNAQERQQALRAVDLCKCDLTTQMVQEFTELQGIMGGIYAKSQGEPTEVADAIYDHYRPVGVKDTCPRSVAGAVVSLADKLDRVVSGFSVGLEPTGSSDPFGLRRAGNGIIKVLVEWKLPLRLRSLLLGATNASLHEFLTGRLAFYLEHGRGLRYDTVRAVLGGTDWKYGSQMPDAPFAVAGNCYDAALRCEALEQVRDSDDFRSLALAAKRTRNILSKSASDGEREAARNPENVNPGLFCEDAEKQLWTEWAKAWDAIMNPNRFSSYRDVFLFLAKLRPAVDRFFAGVMVMVGDTSLRHNRLALLSQLDRSAFSYYADLAEIVPDNVVAPTLNQTTGDG